MLTEGLDFYWNPDGLMVLTAHYLRSRGYCCRSGCRHCPYGFRRDPDEAQSSSAEVLDESATAGRAPQSCQAEAESVGVDVGVGASAKTSAERPPDKL